MRDNEPETIYLKDYQQPSYLVDNVKLTFELDEAYSLVTSVVEYRKNPDVTKDEHGLVLFGRDQELVHIKINGENLNDDSYTVLTDSLNLRDIPDRFVLEIKTKIRPQDNTALEGLYKSRGIFCTQCEAQGFRRITYFLDRPDIMASYETTIFADKTTYPILLSNGNLIDHGDLGGNRHFTKWKDPFPKPSYLFALVAGNLVAIEDSFRTKSNRNITIKIFVEESNRHKCSYAMAAIKDAMKWDEEVYGLEYDLDMYMIVAVNDFNMGAMENKGLNIFNSRYVLADEKTATDKDFLNIQSVIAHEYFHNWSGNRVTCRDWFQLSLKEGFTVFRDQQFSADMSSESVQRIMDVDYLRQKQFVEDQSPLAHPVKPESYIEINNFYTNTVYQKGAELIRMLYIILGQEDFYKGCKLYFSRHDHQAVTTEDFVCAMEDASSVDLTQFKLWYSQAGTPQVSIEGDYDSQNKIFTLHIAQKIPDTPGQRNKKPHLIPIKIALLGKNGQEFNLKCIEGGYRSSKQNELILMLNKARETFVFENIDSKPIPSVCRDFSAPIHVEANLKESELEYLMSYDRNEFNRYEAHQKLATKLILNMAAINQDGEGAQDYSGYLRAFERLLLDESIDPLFLSTAISLPQCSYLITLNHDSDVERLFLSRERLITTIAKAHKKLFLEIYHKSQQSTLHFLSSQAIGIRALKNSCLYYLLKTKQTEFIDLAVAHYRSSNNNMTNAIGALSKIVDIECAQRYELLQDFYSRWKDDPLVLDKWFAMQSGSAHPEVLSHVEELLNHPKFDLLNPNRVRAAFSFISANPYSFHNISGMGYKVVGDYVIKIDDKNPSIAARLAEPLGQWQLFDSKRQQLMRAQLERILASKKLSKDVFEIVSKCL